MDRRESLKALGTMLAGASVSPVTTHEADHVQMVIIRTPDHMSHEVMQRLQDHWVRACEGTPLKNVKTVIFPGGIDVEFVRK